ncbi:hypothetical protein BDW42DRAFT_37984 [Aspergillus taichungensis]|uniref:Uncharacterized protein n=1 Tax=Aspergillus taichungensis TaxID=482145 RepID=A0A2J5HEZ7_9EURO|nr:hypothetical protein BDW42DRAFT_37984 [Aspergillus taichungensis]
MIVIIHDLIRLFFFNGYSVSSPCPTLYCRSIVASINRSIGQTRWETERGRTRPRRAHTTGRKYGEKGGGKLRVNKIESLFMESQSSK